MKKRVVSLALALTVVILSAFSASAAQTDMTPSRIRSGMKRAILNTHKDANIKAINVDPTGTTVTVVVDGDGKECTGTYVLSYCGLATKNKPDMSDVKCGYWFGLYTEDASHDFKGYVRADRVYPPAEQ